MIDVGTSVVDITPPCGLPMSGFAVRSDPARAAHDPLTVRALVVGKTAIVTADVIGVDAALSRRARGACVLPSETVTIVATHTHGGAVSMPGRLAGTADRAFMNRLELALVEAVDTAAANTVPARIFGGVGADRRFAKNRRHKTGPVDNSLPILRFDALDGKPLAIFVSYACHPAVLGPANLSWTGDYVHFVRQELEAACPDLVAIFATGCAGDVNTGHAAAQSLTRQANPNRSYATAAKIGTGLARSILATRLSELGQSIGSGEAFTTLEFEARETGSAEQLEASWRVRATGADQDAALYRIWADWAADTMGKQVDPLQVRTSALNWGGARIVALPGEIFAESALNMRGELPGDAPVFILSYADDNPGYIPPISAFERGGYEVDQAHRFYGMGATFAPGSAERVMVAGHAAVESAAFAAANEHTTKLDQPRGG